MRAPGASLCADDVEFSAEDATRTDRDFLCQVVQAVIDAGATTVNIPDTVGYSMPDDFARCFRMLRSGCAGSRNVIIGALPQRSGAGGGEHDGGGGRWSAAGGMHHQRHRRARRQRLAGRNRDGNPGAARPVSRTRWVSASEQLYPASQLSSEITGVPVQPNKAIVGRNAFAHEAGIHQDGC